MENKANIYEITNLVTESVLVNADQPPYKYSDLLPKGYVVNPNEITHVGDEIIFPIRFGDKIIWVRSAHSNNIVDQSGIDERINNLLKEVEADAGGNGIKPPNTPKSRNEENQEPPKKPENNPKKTSKSIIAIFADNPKSLKEPVLSNANITNR
jgi:hypothetical protein